jgi:hypothetical protein
VCPLRFASADKEKWIHSKYVERRFTEDAPLIVGGRYSTLRPVWFSSHMHSSYLVLVLTRDCCLLLLVVCVVCERTCVTCVYMCVCTEGGLISLGDLKHVFLVMLENDRDFRESVRDLLFEEEEEEE